ncbi:hypothetical protein ACFLRX_01215 [Acidobacteriota bacterium]
MKLSSRKQIETLAKKKSENFLTTSFFFNSNKSGLNKKEIFLKFKNLINDAKSQIDSMDLSKAKKDSLTQDLKQIKTIVTKSLNTNHSSGLAAFSCKGEEFWQIFDLPSPPLNRIIFDQNPYVRPLSAMLNTQKRYGTLTFDRKKAKWYEVYVGEISLLAELQGDVPSKVKEGGWEGYDSKRIERHIATHLHEYLKKIVQKTFSLHKSDRFDGLLVGCPDEYVPVFESLLHPYIKKIFKGYIKTKPSDSLSKINKESEHFIEEFNKKDEEKILHRFISELEKGGRAVTGVKNTIKSLNRGEAQTLLVTRHFSKAGRMCPKCQFLFVNEAVCPSCRIRTSPILDIIDEAIEKAMDKKCKVEHINPPLSLGRYGKIGALLRYKI